MKVRTRRLPGDVQYRFVEFPQAGMVVVRTTDEQNALLEDLERAHGAYVKVMPRIFASERSSVDASAVKRALVAGGALAVVVAPVVVPDATKGRTKADNDLPTKISPERYLKDWLAKAKAMPDVLEAALDDAMSTCGAAGL